jgi:hypothetical protein
MAYPNYYTTQKLNSNTVNSFLRRFAPMKKLLFAKEQIVIATKFAWIEYCQECACGRIAAGNFWQEWS